MDWHSQDFHSVFGYHIKSKKNGKDQESIQSSTTPDQGYHIGKCQKTHLNTTNEGQDVTLLQQVTTRQQ